MQTEPVANPGSVGALMSCRLTVILVSYNVRYFLEQALLSVRRASAGLDIEVFVVDNNSHDGSVEMIRRRFPEIRLIANPDNVGFAKANNQAIRESSGDYILLLNPDTVVEEDTFQAILRYMEAHPEAGALGVKMIDGSGSFLPESKRGFPGPWVAFCQMAGLGRLFPRSRLFNRYHLGFLDQHSPHEVDVLAGAFMLLRREALDRVGLLDERFFMYGEDIDLSYRLQKAGYRNIYFPETRIIHYKGESTRKGSLNYVRAFYQAMILFARKHFHGRKARLFVLLLQGAIYFRAGLTLLGSLIRQVGLPVLDGLLIFGGLLLLKDFWATYHFQDPDYYTNTFLWVNAPLYTLIWIGAIFFSGAYDRPESLWRLLRGLVAGTLLLAAVYGFLDLAYRSSRAIILLGALWASASTVALRFVRHYWLHRNFHLVGNTSGKLVIVGGKAESLRAEQLLHRVGVPKAILGTVAPAPDHDIHRCLGRIDQLEEIAHIYQVSDIVFCSRDVPTGLITHWMTRLGPDFQYRILPEDGLSIIGSPSRNAPGELYTIDIQLNLAQSLQRRNKRLFDLGLSVFLLLTLPLQALVVRPVRPLPRHSLEVLLGKRTWVGYGSDERGVSDLPRLRPGILYPADALSVDGLDLATRRRLDLLYAKDYTLWHDLRIIWHGWSRLGREPENT